MDCCFVVVVVVVVVVVFRRTRIDSFFGRVISKNLFFAALLYIFLCNTIDDDVHPMVFTIYQHVRRHGSHVVTAKRFVSFNRHFENL
jgi:hypothetical protein